MNVVDIRLVIKSNKIIFDLITQYKVYIFTNNEIPEKSVKDYAFKKVVFYTYISYYTRDFKGDFSSQLDRLLKVS